MGTLQYVQALLAAFSERDQLAMDVSESVNQSDTDLRIISYLEELKDFPFVRWLDLCRGIGLTPILAAAATHCAKFEWKLFSPVLEQTNWHVEPFNEVNIASQFCNKQSFENFSSLYELLNSRFVNGTIATAFFVGAQNSMLFDLKELSFQQLEPNITNMLAFFWARDGFDNNAQHVIAEVLKQDLVSEFSRFWIYFSVILRYPYNHDYIKQLHNIAGNNPTRVMVSSALAKAISDGPLTPEEAWFLYEQRGSGPRIQRLIRAFRLASFVPGVCPLIDVFAPWPLQEEQAEKVKAAISQAVVSGVPFVPNTYEDKAHHTKVSKLDAGKRKNKLKSCMAPRGWNDELVAEALANGSGLPVLGYRYGPALLRFHPVTFLPIVSCAKSGEVIHVGRKHFVYNIDWDAYSSISEMSRPPLPVWYDVRSSNPESATVYIPLKEEWIDVWRPAPALFLPDDGPDFYVLRARDIPQDEAQEFWIGVTVRCAPRRFGRGTALVAMKRVERNW